MKYFTNIHSVFLDYLYLSDKETFEKQLFFLAIAESYRWIYAKSFILRGLGKFQVGIIVDFTGFRPVFSDKT